MGQRNHHEHQVTGKEVFPCLFLYRPTCAQEEKKKPTDVSPFTGYMWEGVHSHKADRFSRAKISTSEFKDISPGIAI